MPTPLPERASDTTAESPWPVRTLSLKMGDYIDKMSPLWVEGQIVQLNRRPGSPTCYLTLRDPDVDMSLSVTVHVNTLDAMGPAIQPGARVVVHAKPTFWAKRGSLHLDARRMRAVGVGELLARLEHLKQLLRSEGLFDTDRKRPLPFLPRTVGLICGRASAAEKDVVENARRRMPATRFEIRQVAVQGTDTVPEVTAALRELDALEQVDVIVIARGGGSFEDLMPFSNETLLRAVSAARTPIVSAIGHDVDTPLLDFVADVRASTPTDAAKLIVPDLAEQQQRLDALVATGRRALTGRVAAERRHLSLLRSRPVMTDPASMVTPRRDEIDRLRERAAYRLTDRIARAHDQVTHLRGQLRALSPQQTLERGYAVVRHRDGTVVTDVEQVESDEILRVTVAHGDFGVRPVS
ncbi:exodeoxyribonuclease VII large subunit [Calidifontibacter sp. DB0510]|uniref:Exodeoxyribonuclease 7 large subunit n=1 Tax=Metallococcus carri TaxID=1656884 RepID=A0A967EDX5_9MICO|nr:exodeoxyribonuclease VII large subunit [Metallococcus carri]NHN55126.1 exodeoxyribonuclease VII large subunit [Metallococcus carri]NOP36203.1 exodeoxyribonuclease VII large subunit [Calidifontibacter sp. DB2511S]